MAIYTKLPPGWSRHPQVPQHVIVHDSGRLRITKAAVTPERIAYTVWMHDGDEWIRPGVTAQTELAKAIAAAENLISEEPENE